MIPLFTYAFPLATFVPFWLLFPLIACAFIVRWFLHWPGRNVEIHPIRPSTFQPDDPALLTKQFDSIVIGSGSGGCACANLLAQSGQTVLLLEQHYRTGGCTHTFREQGCEWDTGLHYSSIGMSTRTKRPGALLHFMTKGLQHWIKLTDPYDQVIFPEDPNVAPGLPNCAKYSFVSGKQETVDSILAAIDPDNETLKTRALAWMELCEIINQGFTALGISRVLPRWLHFWVQKDLDQLYTYAAYSVRDVQYAMFNLGYTKEDLLHDCPKAPDGPEPDPTVRRLKAVLTHPIGDYAVQPREATFAAHGITMAHYMQGAAYTVGATQNISLRSSAVVAQMGGEVRVDATVRQILVENGRAVGVLVSNTKDLVANPNASVLEIRAKNVVCATSIYNLYNTLLPQDLPIVKEFQQPEKRSVRQSNGHVFLFCKIRGDADEIGLPTHNLWYFNSYDMDKAFDKYFANPAGERPPTVYIGFPCTKDPTWKKRYPNVSNAVLISDGLWEWFEKWADKPVHDRGADYEAFKSKLENHLLDILYDTVPQAKGRVEFHMAGTPLTEATYLSSYHGGSYGTMCTPEMFAPVNRAWTTTPHTKIPGLYMAGSDAFLPAVCGAMYGGCFGAAAVLGHAHCCRMVWAFLSEFAAAMKEDDPKISWAKAYCLAIDKFLHDE